MRDTKITVTCKWENFKSVNILKRTNVLGSALHRYKNAHCGKEVYAYANFPQWAFMQVFSFIVPYLYTCFRGVSSLIDVACLDLDYITDNLEPYIKDSS